MPDAHSQDRRPLSINRRQLLTLGLAGAGAALLAACGQAPSGSTAPSGSSQSTASKSASGTGSRPAASASASSPSPPASAVKVSVGVIGSTSDAGFYIGQTRGYFKQEGIDIELKPFQTGPAMVAPMGTGELDVGGGASSAALFNAIGRGIPLRIVADKGSHRPGFIFTYVPIQKSLVGGAVKSWADLKGRKVALGGTGNSGEIFVDVALKRGGLTIKDVQTVTMPYPNMGAAFSNKAIDAALAIEPFVTEWLQRDFVAVLPDKEQIYPEYQAAVVMYSPKFIQSSPDTAKRLMVGYLRAVRDYNDAFSKGKDKEAIINILIKETSLKDRQLYDKMGLPGLNPNGYVISKDLAFQQDWYVDHGYQKEKIDLKPVIDNQFVDDALARLGNYSG